MNALRGCVSSAVAVDRRFMNRHQDIVVMCFFWIGSYSICSRMVVDFCVLESPRTCRKGLEAPRSILCERLDRCLLSREHADAGPYYSTMIYIYIIFAKEQRMAIAAIPLLARADER